MSVKHAAPRGFSLLEVMVALALLALSFTALILVQGRATSLAAQAKNISIATQLARYQLAECKREAQKQISATTDVKLEGDFTELNFPDFKWECHAPKFSMKAPTTADVEKKVKESAKKTNKVTGNEGTTASLSSPFISMITDSLSTSVRELAVIIRWTDNGVDEEVRVVTHIIDLTSMQVLARMLNEGAKTFTKNMAGAKKEGEGAGEDERGQNPGGGQPPRGPGGDPYGPPGGGYPGGGYPGGGPPGYPGGPPGGGGGFPGGPPRGGP